MDNDRQCMLIIERMKRFRISEEQKVELLEVRERQKFRRENVNGDCDEVLQ